VKRSSHIHSGQLAAAVADPWPESLDTDPRWRLAQRIAAEHPFERSPLMSRFLLYVVAETLMGRQSGITEHQIGVHVFGRAVTYRTDEDNIVRNYARQLRRRLAEHFSEDSSPMRIEIPVGGYIPIFTNVAEEVAGRSLDFDLKLTPEIDPHSQSHPTLDADTSEGWKPSRHFFYTSRFFGLHPITSPLLLALYSAALIGCTWLLVERVLAPHLAHEPAEALWRTMLAGTNNTYVVPPDTGLNLMQDMSGRSLPLADYIKGGYPDLALGPMDDQTTQDLHTQQFTDYVSLQIATTLAHQREYDEAHVHLRFPRDLRLDDLKTSNVILIGSASSNPWAAFADSQTNFRIVPNADMRGASIVNGKPQPGEAVSYASHWNEPAHETYALLAFVPNLSGNGHILLLEGLDVAGTQSAAELLFHSKAIAPVLERVQNPDGSLRSFEILLRSTSIQSNAAGSQIVATRIH
jgi:hypothetical protein